MLDVPNSQGHTPLLERICRHVIDLASRSELSGFQDGVAPSKLVKVVSHPHAKSTEIASAVEQWRLFAIMYGDIQRGA